MRWLPWGVWIGVVVLAAVVLGYCAYEVSWKARRLRRDLESLAELGARAQALAVEAEALQQRLASVAATHPAG